MKMNAKVTDSLSEKIFGNYPPISEKQLWCQIVLTKSFCFPYIHQFLKTLMWFSDFVSPRAAILCDMFTSGKGGFLGNTWI